MQAQPATTVIDAPTTTPAPRVSVIVRSLDRSFLAEALASVAAQTWPHIETIVVAARPGHAPLPELPQMDGQRQWRLLQTDTPRLRSQNANAGLDAASGRYLIFLDDDDWFMPGHIERLVQALQSHPHAKAAYTGVAMVDAEMRPYGQAFDLPFDAVRQLAGNLTPIHAVLFDRSLVEQGCRFDESLDRYEDWDFWLQLARQTAFVHLPGVSAIYRIHDSSGVHEDTGAQGQSSGRIYSKWMPRLDAEQVGELMRRVWSHSELEDKLADEHERRLQAQRTVDEAYGGLRARLDAVADTAQGLAGQLQAQQAAQLTQAAQAAQAQERNERFFQQALADQAALREQLIEQQRLPQQLLAELSAARQQLAEQLADQRGRLAAQAAQIADQNAQLARQAAQLAELQERNRQLARFSEQLQLSTSWRITAPLRALVTLITRRGR